MTDISTIKKTVVPIGRSYDDAISLIYSMKEEIWLI